MTKKGWKSVLISENSYNEGKNYMKEINEREGFKKIRSFAHLLELALAEYLKSEKEQD